MSNSDMPAMPTSVTTTLSGGIHYGEPGLTKREYFAGLAMQGIYANSQENSPAGDFAWTAVDAVKAADALLAELEKEPTQ
jgi:hypothetical protein